jgi:hypothetical protein
VSAVDQKEELCNNPQSDPRVAQIHIGLNHQRGEPKAEDRKTIPAESAAEPHSRKGEQNLQGTMGDSKLFAARPTAVMQYLREDKRCECATGERQNRNHSNDEQQCDRESDARHPGK